jgi:hypothetical protein
LALAERLLAVLMHDLEQRLFQVLLPTCCRRALGSGHPVPSQLLSSLPIAGVVEATWMLGLVYGIGVKYPSQDEGGVAGVTVVAEVPAPAARRGGWATEKAATGGERSIGIRPESEGDQSGVVAVEWLYCSFYTAMLMMNVWNFIQHQHGNKQHTDIFHWIHKHVSSKLKDYL